VSVSTALSKKPNNLAPAAPPTQVTLVDNVIKTTTTSGDVKSETSATISSSTSPTAAASATIAAAATIEKVHFNPFLPYDPTMFVAEINGTHNLLLNKYNVVDYHMVLATKDFQPQTDPLNEIDLAALYVFSPCYKTKLIFTFKIMIIGGVL
jgi:ATP adenylyltransferase/5',5'''-P-1,P-4-tetraphosphate phosphorylase II